MQAMEPIKLYKNEEDRQEVIPRNEFEGRLLSEKKKSKVWKSPCAYFCGETRET